MERFFVFIFCFTFINSAVTQNDSMRYFVLMHSGLNLTHLKGYENYLGDKFIKSVPSTGYEIEIGMGINYKKIKLNAGIGFKKSKSNYLTLSEPYNDIALFDENFIRIDLVLHKFFSSIELGYQILHKHSLFILIQQSFNTYNRATIVNNKSLENPDPNLGTSVFYTNFYLHSHKPETILGFAWEYSFAKRWNLFLKSSTSIVPYELSYQIIKDPQTRQDWTLPIHEWTLGFQIQYIIKYSKFNL